MYKRNTFFKKMYSPYDFRYIIEDSTQMNTAWRAILREPLQEVLNYWERSGKPQVKLEIYCKGIYEGIVNQRWMLFQLDLLANYPEFYKCAYLALLELWNQLNFKLQTSAEPALLIDLPEGQTLPWQATQKEYVLQVMRHSLCIDLWYNQELVSMGIFTSRHAEDIYQRIFWLQSAIKMS